MIFTSHKPLMSVMNNNSDKYTSHIIRYLDYISQFTTDLCYVEGKNNTVANTLLWTGLYNPRYWYSGSGFDSKGAEIQLNSARRTGKHSSGASWISSPFQQQDIILWHQVGFSKVICPSYTQETGVWTPARGPLSSLSQTILYGLTWNLTSETMYPHVYSAKNARYTGTINLKLVLSAMLGSLTLT